MFEKVPAEAGLVAGEHEVLRFWRERDAFEKLRRRNAGKPKWSFLDGPITANNPMGVHHAWGRTYKDAFQRYFAMTGHDQRWQNGFDCQGLWVEVQVERELGFRSKRDIEEYGLERFINACKERVRKYSAVQTQQSIRLGMWMDWDNSYYTMSEENNYTIWGFLKKCHQRGLIYKGLDSMPWCPRCGTGISEQERKDGYQLIEDEAVYVRFPLRGRPGEHLLVWTTTPWTLSANVAAAVNPDFRYLRVRQGDDVYHLSAGRLDVLASEPAPEVLGEVGGGEMIGWEFDGPFDELEGAAAAVAAHRVIAWDEVSEAQGTGIVHIAPGCGKEDFDLGRELGLPVIAPIDESGIYLDGFGFLSGQYAGAVAEEIYGDLKSKGLFYKREKYVHDYPHCWRCDTPLLFRAVDEWYIDMSWRDEIKRTVEQIRWIPDYGEAQELDWLTNMRDWMISKKRYWGLALPIWECSSCGGFDVIESREELQERAVAGWEDFAGHSPHRPWVDMVKIGCPHCGSVAARIPDVGNPWLDAGIVPYSTVYYRTDRESWSKWIPADFVVESFPGQFRNWFYSLLAMSTMMEGIAPFRTLLGYALVRDEQGEEFSKSRYYIEFNEAADRISADVMRWTYCRHTPTNNLNFGYGLAEQLQRKVFGTLWNTYLFFVNYAILDSFDAAAAPIPVAERPEIDRWILSNLQLLVRSANEAFPDYWIAPFVRRAEEFIDDLSNWYVRRNRRRFWDPRGKDERDKTAAYQTLYEVLVTLTKLLAPIIPFLSERMYQNLVVEGLGAEGQPESVHHCEYPQTNADLIDETLTFEMKVVQQVVGAGHALRERAGHRVRQPLQEIHVAVSDGAHRAALEGLGSLVTDELNVKRMTIAESLGHVTSVSARPNFGTLGPRLGADAQKVAALISGAAPDVVRSWQQGRTVHLEAGGSVFEVGPDDLHVHHETAPGWMVGESGALQVALAVELTPELRREGLARDVVRHIQNLRREAGLVIEDRIALRLWTDDPELAESIREWETYICAETQCDELARSEQTSEAWEVKIGERTLRVELRRVER